MKTYKIQNFELNFLALYFDRAAVFNVFIISDEVLTVAVYFFFGNEIHRLKIANAHLMVFKFC